MNVKSAFTVFNMLNISYLCFIIACFLIAISINIIRVPNEKLLEKQTHLAMRAIGDELLKLNDDFSTPVPSIQRIGSEMLRLKFDIPIVIYPDSLVNLSLKYFDSEIARKSIVSVRVADTEEVVYGFEINHFKERDIPCLGRTLPESNYVVEVSFYDQTTKWFDLNVPALSVASASILFTFFGFSFLEKKSVASKKKELEWNGIKLDFELNRITANHERIQLTDKETQILVILFEHVGNLVSREFLIQEVWLKKGVVTGRSLDMYISRLRKKMEVLPNVQIANQHGKGYFLKIR